MSQDSKGKRLGLKSFKFSNKRWLCDQNMIETQRQRHLASSFGDRRSRQVRHDHINYWNCSTGRSEDIFVWKATGTHGSLKHFLINYRNCFTGKSEDEKKIYLCRWAWGKVTEFPFILLCVSVCVQLDADKWWYWQKHSFQQQRVRSCVGEIFFSMLPGGVANINTGGTSYKIISRADMKT